MSGWAFQFPGPGSSVPGRRLNFSRFWFIETMPATYEVYTLLERR